MAAPTTNSATVWPEPPAWWRDAPADPPPPPEDEFTMYGVTRSTGPPPPPEALEDQRYESKASPYASLRSLHRELFAAYTSLLQSLSSARHSPDAVQSQLTEVRVLIVNIQHCLNSLRAKRANEDLILILRSQLARKRAAILALDSACDGARAQLRLHQEEGPAAGAGAAAVVSAAPQVGGGLLRGQALLAAELLAAGQRAGLKTLSFPPTPSLPPAPGVGGGTKGGASVGARLADEWGGREGAEAFGRLVELLGRIPP